MNDILDRVPTLDVKRRGIIDRLADKWDKGERSVRRRVKDNDIDIIFIEKPSPFFNGEGLEVGIQVKVRVFQAGVELNIDPHRIVINPPLKVKSGRTRKVVTDEGLTVDVPEYKEDADEAFMQWLEDSVINYPGLRKVRG